MYFMRYSVFSKSEGDGTMAQSILDTKALRGSTQRDLRTGLYRAVVRENNKVIATCLHLHTNRDQDGYRSSRTSGWAHPELCNLSANTCAIHLEKLVKAEHHQAEKN